jgi:hypothetical protein
MPATTNTEPSAKRDRAALRRRALGFYEAFNEGDWDECRSRVDPELRADAGLDEAAYERQLREFRDSVGVIRPWYVRISLHLNPTKNQRDRRPFAFVYVVWQDARDRFHMFRERWVRDDETWYTRVVGLVAAGATNRMENEQ